MKVALVYPGSRKEMESSLGFHIIKNILKEEYNVNTFHTDSYFSVEENLPLKSFDTILASVHFELQLPKLMDFLRKSKIELRREKRKKLLVLGGPGVWNPLPVKNIADGVVVGDGENVVKEAVNSKEHTGKGYYNCWTGEKTKFERSRLDYIPPPLISDGAYGKKTSFVEPSRGCGFGCRFCLIGWTQRPRRDRKLSEILGWISESVRRGAEKIVFFGSDVLSHPHMKKILEILCELEVPFSIPSTRAETIEEFLPVLKYQRTITIAVEAASERIREKLNKRTPTNDEIFDTIRKIRKEKKKVRVYMMYCLPGEDDAELNEKRNLIKDFVKLGCEVSLSAFVPKPYTPFQYFDFDPENAIRICKTLKIPGVKRGNPKKAHVQAMIAKGDEKVGDILVREHTTYRSWIALWRKPKGTPWMNAVDTGIGENVLKKECNKNGYTPPCSETCWRCGVCM